MAPPLTATSAAVALSSEVYYRNVMLFVPGSAALVAVVLLFLLWRKSSILNQTTEMFKCTAVFYVQRILTPKLTFVKCLFTFLVSSFFACSSMMLYYSTSTCTCSWI